MSRITRISWGRTYNTGNFTSYRVDLEYALADTDEPYDTMALMAGTLHDMALNVLRERGVRYIIEQGGTVSLETPTPGTTEGDDDVVPF